MNTIDLYLLFVDFPYSGESLSEVYKFKTLKEARAKARFLKKWYSSQSLSPVFQYDKRTYILDDEEEE